ncbi:hypothetical protein FGO68_gene10076 [Halteria grandinella]|uniref:Uncharacterized protein n=1 Tax=Halteria grandinella TaxID=5974 RepID=A0A8J8T4L9_HALGN|nr:hypothetical protein FGO68_gene10076 [Halteria grandinella]
MLIIKQEQQSVHFAAFSKLLPQNLTFLAPSYSSLQDIAFAQQFKCAIKKLLVVFAEQERAEVWSYAMLPFQINEDSASVSFQNIARDEIILLNFVHFRTNLNLILLKTFFNNHIQNQLAITSNVIIINCVKHLSSYIKSVIEQLP